PRPAAIDPLAVLQLVAFPGLADGEAHEQRDQRREQQRVVAHARPSCSYDATTASQRFWARRISSTSSRTAPAPPGCSATKSTRERTSGTASAGAEDSPARLSTARSTMSSPMYATCSSFSTRSPTI